MNYKEFLEIVINDGIVAAGQSYSRDDQKMKLKGALAGFNACRNFNPSDLSKLLRMARKSAQEHLREPGDDYWWFRCFEAEVEWVCNCVSAFLTIQGEESLDPNLPTARGMLRASAIIESSSEFVLGDFGSRRNG